MATIIDTKVNAKIAAKITKYGRDITLRVYPAAVIDEVNSTFTPGTPTNHTIKGFGPIEYNKFYVDGETIKAGDCYFILKPTSNAGVAVIPELGNEIPDADKVWRVVNVNRLSGGDDVAAYELQVRS